MVRNQLEKSKEQEREYGDEKGNELGMVQQQSKDQ